MSQMCSAAHEPLTPAETAMVDQCEAALADADIAGRFDEGRKHLFSDAADLLGEVAGKLKVGEDISVLLAQAIALLEAANTAGGAPLR